MTGLFVTPKTGYGREFEMVLKVLPILGPSKRTTAITTRATSARIIAYSTSPCPLSFDANNMTEFLSIKKYLSTILRSIA